MKETDFAKIEKKWQKAWEDKKAFEVKEDKKKQKYYVLEMFPYPSGTGLHMGHAHNYNIGDIYSRFKRMQGFNVLHPMGFDSFGLPAENAAIKAKSHPKKFTEEAIANFIRQMKDLGLSYDWSRMVETHKPDYYRWDQWIFLKMYEKGLVYRKKSPVNWCPKCNTVLANEQVIGGKCWRHEDTNVEIKHLEQWFFKITHYADEIYEDLNKLDDWPELIKRLQRNWIGKSEGAEIDFIINKEKWKIFTTRPDTIFGVTFLVISAQHPRLMDIVTSEQKAKVQGFVKKLHSVKEEDLDKMEKEGVFTGAYASHPLTGEKIPVYAGNFVLADYGSGMVMGVPAHDERDYEFAKKYKLPIKYVVKPEKAEKIEGAYEGVGILVNSDSFNGLQTAEAKEHIIKVLETKKLGKKVINFRLRDWLISRQRFWGTPIPIVYCDKCGVVPVPEKDLPIVLPEKIEFKGVSNPLLQYKPFLEAKCPNCKGPARRETDTMDTFVNSSWYFLRYCDSHNDKKIFDSAKANYWCPIDVYVGGKEHACLHLIYFRFYTKFLRDLGLINFGEPARRLFNQGFLLGPDGERMSKSKGNVILPEVVSKKYGIDVARLFLVSIASPDKDIMWSDEGIDGTFRFLKRVFSYVSNMKEGKTSKKIESKIHSTIKKITEEIENFKYNLAVIRLRELFESFEHESIAKSDFNLFIRLLSPFAPHLSEELWQIIGNKGFVSLAPWPEADEKKIDEKFEQAEKSADKTVSDILNVLRIVDEKKGKANKVYVYVMPFELEYYDSNELTKRVGKPVMVFSVSDKKKHDPQGKASKAKPGKPGIYVE
ncbi:leucine--tRNA ligase [Candidatus Pacearchaeota archaeon]|nr:leucine--tRNA ligase [Candidatus Pacearchaeota archaeon]